MDCQLSPLISICALLLLALNWQLKIHVCGDVVFCSLRETFWLNIVCLFVCFFFVFFLFLIVFKTSLIWRPFVASFFYYFVGSSVVGTFESLAPVADLEGGTPPLIFTETGLLTLCGRPGAAAFLLKMNMVYRNGGKSMTLRYKYTEISKRAQPTRGSRPWPHFTRRFSSNGAPKHMGAPSIENSWIRPCGPKTETLAMPLFLFAKDAEAKK